MPSTVLSAQGIQSIRYSKQHYFAVGYTLAGLVVRAMPASQCIPHIIEPDSYGLAYVRYDAERQSALDAATDATSQARAEHERSRAVLRIPGEPGKPLTVPSRVKGRILRIMRESAGSFSAGSPIFQVGDLSRLEVTAPLLQRRCCGAEVRERV